MKRLSMLVFVLVMAINESYSQEHDSNENTINNRLFPTYNSDFSYYYLRRNMRLEEFLVGTEFSAYKNGGVNFRTKFFLPVYGSKKITYDIPVYVEKYEFNDRESAFRKNVYNVFGQSILGLYPSEYWSFSHIVEFRLRGDGETLTKRTGNFIAQFVTARYAFNKKLALIGGALVGMGWDYREQSETSVKPAFMVTWKPNPKLSLMAGVPGMAVEWSMPLGFDLVVHSLMDNEDVNVTAAVRKNMGNRFDLTGRFIREGYSELNVTTNFVAPSLANAKTADLYYNRIQLELGIRTDKNTVIQLFGGCGMNRNLKVKAEEGVQLEMRDNDEFYFGASLNRRLPL